MKTEFKNVLVVFLDIMAHPFGLVSEHKFGTYVSHFGIFDLISSYHFLFSIFFQH